MADDRYEPPTLTYLGRLEVGPKYDPLAADHPLVTEARPCFICGNAFAAGDETALVTMEPADEEQAARRAAGRAYTVRAEPIHWDCRPRAVT